MAASGKSYDAIVIGAGAIGLACAWFAARRGLRVCVLDRDAPGSGASGVAAGMLAPVGEASWGEEELLGLNVAAAARWSDFADELEEDAGLPPAYRRTGALHVALDRDEAEELRRHHELQRSLRLEAEWLRPRECRRLEPGISPACAGGVLAGDDGEVDPRTLVAALVAALERHGATLHSGVEPSEAILAGDRIAGVRTSEGTALYAESVVLAAGCWSAEASWLPRAARPPVRPVKGQILTVRGSASEPLCERIVVTERVYVVPRGDGRVVVGATVEERGFDLSVTAGGVHELLREAYRVLPEIAELELEETRAGLRPGTPDNAPLIGPSAVEGLLVATGHYRNGILLAPVTGEAIAALLAGEEPPVPIGAFDPLRFVERGKSAGPQAVAEGAAAR